MKSYLSLPVAVLAISLAACDRKPRADEAAGGLRTEDQRLADERRLIELRELEQRAAARESAEQIERDREALASERAMLERDRAKLNEEQRRTTDQRLTQIREEQRVNAEREEQRKADERLAVQRRAEDAAAATTVQQQTLDFFYEALDPHGEWVEVERYGYCWQPRGGDKAGWRPYQDGHWVYTDYGWTWDSQEPFGWATYHYGRWARVQRLGWVWVPGSEWAPAWVSWRRSDQYVGWAPLPPEAHSSGGFNGAVDSYYDIGPGSYNFVPVESLGSDNYAGQVLEPERNVTFIDQTVNVTNTTYQRVDNRTVQFNGGPDFDEIKRRSNVRRVHVERVAKAPAARDQRGDVLRLLAPFIASAAKPAGEPKKVRERVRTPVIERGWNDRDSVGVTRVRDQQKREARKAEQTEKAPIASRPADAGEPVRPPRAALPMATPAPGQQPTAERPRRPGLPEGEAPRRGTATPTPGEPATANPTQPALPEERPPRMREGRPPTAPPAGEPEREKATRGNGPDARPPRREGEGRPDNRPPRAEPAATPQPEKPASPVVAPMPA
jgi:hypothetical protein